MSEPSPPPSEPIVPIEVVSDADSSPLPAPAPSPPPAPAEPLALIEDHQRETATPDWLHAAALRLERWGLGRELTRTDYLAALERAAHHPCGA